MSVPIPWRTMDEDSPLVSVGNTGVYTVVYSYTTPRIFIAQRASVTVFDMAALPLLQWRVCRGGNVLNKLSGLRTFCYQGAVHIREINEQMFPLEVLTVEVLNPVASGVAFDVVARLTGKDTR